MNLLLSGNIRNGSAHNVISLMLIFAFVLLLAYLAAKLTAKLQGNPLNKKANIKIVDSLRLGGNKFISIVKIGTNYYALGFGKDEITLIDKLDESSINLPDNLKPESDDELVEENADSTQEKKNFKDILLSNINKNK